MIQITDRCNGLPYASRMGTDSPDDLASIESLKEELRKLTELHLENLKLATFGDMTADEVRESNDRLNRIKDIVRQLGEPQKPSSR